MTQAKLSSIVKIVTVFATIFLLVLVCIVCYQYVRINSLSSKSASLDAKIAELSITQANLEEGIEIRSTDAYVEQQAREQLGMIKSDGEVVYVVK